MGLVLRRRVCCWSFARSGLVCVRCAYGIVVGSSESSHYGRLRFELGGLFALEGTVAWAVEGARIRGCENARMREDAWMQGCVDVRARMLGCAGARVRGCAGARMRVRGAPGVVRVRADKLNVSFEFIEQ